jgi:uncharacterized membrane protein YvbJ
VPPLPAAARAIPWARVFAVARLVVARLDQDIAVNDRKRVAALLRKSKGDPRRLSADERRDLLKILRQVDFRKLGRDVATTAATAGLLKRGR